MSIKRRSFLHSLGMAAAGMGAGMAAAPLSVAGGAQDSNAPKMKVTGLKTILLHNIRPYIGHRKWLFIQLFTDEGIVGSIIAEPSFQTPPTPTGRAFSPPAGTWRWLGWRDVGR